MPARKGGLCGVKRCEIVDNPLRGGPRDSLILAQVLGGRQREDCWIGLYEPSEEESSPSRASSTARVSGEDAVGAPAATSERTATRSVVLKSER